MDKEGVEIYTLEFYSVVKNNDILNFACKWIETENTLLSEITQTQKDEYGVYSAHKWIIAINKGQWAYNLQSYRG